MASQELQLNQGRLKRLAMARAKDLSGSIDTESESWNDVIEDARTGRPRLLGEENPVLIINMSELEALIHDVLKPEVWGEYFFPSPHQVPEGGIVLGVPTSRGGVRSSYKIDIDDEN